MHIGFIMDGNRRWATARGLPKIAGHKYGADTLKNIIKILPKYNITTATFYTLSTENLKNRTKKEISTLFSLFEKMLDENIKNLIEKEIKLSTIGDISAFPDTLREKIETTQQKTKNFKKIHIILALNYGGRDEIARAAEKARQNGWEITENNFGDFLDSAGTPNPDLIVRTGGKSRISNFLLWQAAYSTWYFTSKMWPDFDETELQKSLEFLKSGGQSQNFGE